MNEIKPLTIDDIRSVKDKSERQKLVRQYQEWIEQQRISERKQLKNFKAKIRNRKLRSEGYYDKYYAEHPELKKKYARKHRKKHKKKMREYAKQYYNKHAEERRKYGRERYWKLKNGEW